MKLQQLSVFIENKPGQLLMVCELLSREGINISALSQADTKQFGILRLIVQDWAAAKRLLESNDFTVKVTEVLALDISNEPGGLVELLRPLNAASLNIEYMYAFASGRNGKAVMIFRFTDPDRALQILNAAGINVIDKVELFGEA
jgi:hypothetical protein